MFVGRRLVGESAGRAAAIVTAGSLSALGSVVFVMASGGVRPQPAPKPR